MVKTLEEQFYLQNTVDAARNLLGKFIVRELTADTGEVLRLSARIVETEAYTPDDPASHSFRGPTPRTGAMFRKGGTSYVYLIYGIHHCFNIVTGPEGYGGAVLIRAAEAGEGLQAIWNGRFPGVPFTPAKTLQLLSGPGMLCSGLGITREQHNGLSLLSGELTIQESPGPPPEHIIQDRRIGITKGTGLLRRFLLEKNPAVSRKPSSSAFHI